MKFAKEQITECQKFYSLIIRDSLGNEPTYSRLLKLREKHKNLNKENDDKLCKDWKGERRVTGSIKFKWHSNIAEEMQLKTGIFNFEDGENIKVFDICMAPGRSTAAILKDNPKARCFGLTMPESLGGLRVLFHNKKLEKVVEQVVTLLIKEYSDSPIPRSNPLKSRFSDERPLYFFKFNLIFCDGVVLRKDQVTESLNWTKSSRLIISQLILAMQRIRKGGTIVLSIWKIDSWESFLIVYKFSKFSKVCLFKSLQNRIYRSSAYIIARQIDTDSERFKKALLDWRADWWSVTFGGPDGTGIPSIPDENYLRQALKEFREEFIEMAKPLWKIQADALSSMEFSSSSTFG